MRANFSGHSTNQPLHLLEANPLFGIQINRFLKREREIGHNLCEAPTLLSAQLCHHLDAAAALLNALEKRWQM